jgi:hypothetical protein
MRALLAVMLGAVIAAIVACGSSAPKNSTTTHPPAAPDAGMSPTAMPQQQRARIDELDRQISEAFESWHEARPGTAGMQATVQATEVRPSSDPTCKPAQSETCSDSCKLGNSICDNATEICKIAAELGDDAYARDKCTSGQASCKKARERCCSCML